LRVLWNNAQRLLYRTKAAPGQARARLAFNRGIIDMIRKDLFAFVALLTAMGSIVLSSNLTFAGAVDLAKTGQATCYDSGGNAIACDDTGQDGDVQAGVKWPDPRFVDNGDGTITDKLTGLMWLKDANCFGTATWNGALMAVADLNAHPKSYTCGGYTANYSDWTLPNVNELESITHAESATSTWLNGEGYLNVKSDPYWSSTSYAIGLSYGWVMVMGGGAARPYEKTKYYYVWPVRAVTTQPAAQWRTGQTTSYAANDDGELKRGMAWPVPRFKDNLDGTVTDNLTGLMWLKHASCLGAMPWQEALDEVANLNTNPGDYECGGYTAECSDWRLPNRRELHSLTDFSQSSPALPDGHVFLGVETLSYWSSTSFGGAGAWAMLMASGRLLTDGKSTYNHYVWPVRDCVLLPEVTTAPVLAITQTAATSGGSLTSDGGATVTARGVCWSTSPNPTTANSKTTDGMGTGSFTSSLAGLTPGTPYYVRAYATNSAGTAYGNEVSFTTSADMATVITMALSAITSTGANSGGNVTADGGAAVTARGVCWSTTLNPTTANSITTNGSGTGSFTSSLAGLIPGTPYYVRAYATNSVGTAYGNEVQFETSATTPAVTTAAATSITNNSATSGGSVTSDGGETVTFRGVCWSTSPNPTTANSKTTNGTGTGSFTSNLIGLIPGTPYYVRAYATNAIGTAYGNQVSFTTTAGTPTVTTSAVTGITQTTATSGGNVTSDGGSSVTARGVCWSTSPNPTTANNKTTNGTGTGSFTSNLTGLTPGTPYYVRAYATNSQGTGYGNQVSFTTSAGLPAVTTSAVSGITSTSATSGGNVTSDGGTTVTARGVCWSTSPNPTTANSKTTNGTGTGSFTSNLTGLTPGTPYYVRAYATNSQGTGYGNQVSFTTSAGLPAVTTSAVSGITSTSATSGGNVTSDGGVDVTARGVCWSTSEQPTTDDPHTSNGSGEGTFASQLTGLTPGTLYYVCAYAVNSQGTSYGSDVSFTTHSAGMRYVHPFSSCGEYQPCYSTIQGAIDAATDGETILVCHGDYPEAIVMDQPKSLKLLCGRNDDFSPSTLFSTAHDLQTNRGTLIIEGLRLSSH
jgi:hypothetical protein